MLLDRTQKTWFIGTVIVASAATAAYVVYALASPDGPSGGSLAGLSFGIAGSLMMIFAGLLAVRRRLPRLRVGSAQFWLRGHIWLGTLSALFILFHSGFGIGGPLETMLMACFLVVALSGFFGLAMQQILPRLLTSRIPMETFGEQIPFLCRRLTVESDLLVSEFAGRLSCEHESMRDAAYNLADSLGRLRNGKEEADLQAFLSAIYVTSNGEPVQEPAAKSVTGVKSPAAARSAGPVHAPKTATADQPAAKSADAAKAPSKLDQMRAAAAAKAQHAAAGDASTASPPEKAPAATPTAASGDAPGNPPKRPPIKAGAARQVPAARPLGAEAEGGATKPSGSKRPPISKKPASRTKPAQLAPRADDLKAFHLQAVRPFLSGDIRHSSLQRPSDALQLFRQKRNDLPAELHPALDRLEAICYERRQFFQQQRIHRWLHGWLMVHIPVSAALLVLFVAHVVISLRVVPWPLQF